MTSIDQSTSPTAKKITWLAFECIRQRNTLVEDSVQLSLVVVQPELGREVLVADFAGELLTVDADHVPPVAGVVLEPLAADVAGEQLDVGVGGDVVLQVVSGEETLPAQLADVDPTLLAGVVLQEVQEL